MSSHRSGASPTTPSRRLPALLLGAAIASSLLAGGADGDDTEVFFGQVSPERAVRPNVLFVIDTSGSMDWGREDWQDPAPGEPSRLDMLKKALFEVLDSTSDVNVGLMRTNGQDGGGAVIYPIAPIDEDTCADGSCVERRTGSRPQAESDNAEQSLERNRQRESNTVTDGNILSLGRDMGASGERQATGMRFPDLDVPQGAKILAARIDFTARHADTGHATLEIRAEATDDAPPYLHDSVDGVTSRPTTSARIDWRFDNAWEVDHVYPTPDLARLVQTVVDRDGWCGGQALALQIEGRGRTNRDAYTVRGNRSKAPRLQITYTLDPSRGAGTTGLPSANRGCQIQSASSQVRRTADDVLELYQGSVYTNTNMLEFPYVTRSDYNTDAGVRFDKLAVPRGAPITSAAIEFTNLESRGGDVRLRIRAEDSDDARSYDGTRRRNLTSRSYSPAAEWRITGNGQAGEPTMTTDLSALVGRITRRNGWTPGNALAFRFSGTDGQRDRRTFFTFERDAAKAARLIVGYKSFVPFLVGGGTMLARDQMKAQVAGLEAHGGTPVVDALFEASRYLQGLPVGFGLRRGTNTHWNHRVSHAGSWTGGAVERPDGCTENDLGHPACAGEFLSSNPVYRSQLNQSCQANSIVLLTDGEPSGSKDQGGIESMIGTRCATDGITTDGQCAPDLAAWMSGEDLNPHVAGDQKIRTHTVSFNLDGNAAKDTVLRMIAEAGDGETFKADDTDSLIGAFRTILSSVDAIDTSFTAPGATVNQYNRLTHRSDIYFALFRPDDAPRWDGNLKKYRIDRGGDPSGELEIRGRDRRPAVDPETGFFFKDAKSYWMPEDNGGRVVSDVDGATVSKGGVANRMENVSGRRLYTFLGEPTAIPAGGIDLDASADHRFTEANPGITAPLLGVDYIPASDRAAYRDNLLRWARGVDVDDGDSDGETDDGRRHVGDPMHSRPVIVNYAGDESVIYLSTNEGFLHALDTADGEEKWGFMPRHLFSNIDRFYINTASTKHPYGLDGQLSVWRDDPNQNYVVDADETAMLFAGMRRGGRNYYGFDISEPDDPSLAWTIEGGVTGSDFQELGQSWSKATPARMMIEGRETEVLVFGGGYDETGTQDPDYDDPANRRQPEDTMGRALFIVDARTGRKLWSVGHADAHAVDTAFEDMDYALPADVRVVDIDLDGLADQLYAADMGGQVWRFDLKKAHAAGEALVQGGVIADLAGDGDAGHRRFYNEPDVAVIEKGGNRFMSIGVGSGWRAHPLDKTQQDRFYVIKSPFVRRVPEAGQYGREVDGGGRWRPIVESDLIDVAAATGVPEANDHGWYLDFATTGEKVLGKSVTFDDSLVFSTYVPDATAEAKPCEPSIGGGRAYVLSAVNGYPTRDISGRDNSADFITQDRGDGTIDIDDRSINLMHGGIAPEPAILIAEDGSPLVVFGPEKLETGFDNGTRRTFWADRGAAQADGRQEPVTVSEGGGE